ncbi:hypothetical protein F4677DRAFT_50924 [Hypoxylon crocopeplum]|nr:hypothetical protein F4677DRAFT_50924 [Hypoxylon crocopeplum]
MRLSGWLWMASISLLDLHIMQLFYSRNGGTMAHQAALFFFSITRVTTPHETNPIFLVLKQRRPLDISFIGENSSYSHYIPSKTKLSSLCAVDKVCARQVSEQPISSNPCQAKPAYGGFSFIASTAKWLAIQILSCISKKSMSRRSSILVPNTR